MTDDRCAHGCDNCADPCHKEAGHLSKRHYCGGC